MNEDGVSRQASTLHRSTPIGRRTARLAFGRKLWLGIHRYVGLLAGAVFVIIGLTGSILAFRTEIDKWLNRELMFVPQPAEGNRSYRPLDEIIAASKAAAPPNGTPLFVHFPKDSSGYFDVIYSPNGSLGHHTTNDGIKKVYQVIVNPFDAAVIGQRLIVDSENHFSEPFVNVVIHLHYTLLQGEVGENIVGAVGLFLFGSIATGVYLWWPRNGKWRQAFSIKRRSSAERLIFDLHKTTGVYVCAVILVMAFSGVYIIFMPQVRALVGAFSSVSAHMIPEDIKSDSADGRPPIGAETAVAVVNRLFRDGRLMSLRLPDGPEGVYVIGKRADDEVSKSEPSRLVAVDQYSGRILKIQDPHDFTAGERFLEWQYPLHTGEAFGDIGRAFICAFGFVPLLLYTTGVTRWLRNRRARRSSRVISMRNSH
ncbi:MAG: PepSY domain-containing protein [Alphaproteobacteria bacterium]|nr:PepSY domain-containing protein [Alphaproteobacteria bacterium]MBM3654868.1 PepSY domain-containing protein [Alphaproteobacteria bacterium]